MASDATAVAALSHPRGTFDPRLRIVAAAMLAFGFSTLTQPAALLAMVAITAAVVAASGIAPAVLWRRLRLPGLVTLGVVALLPLIAGETVLWQLGPLRLRAEGLAAALTILVRLMCILGVAAALLHGIPAQAAVGALRRLGVPWLLTDLALLVARYLEELRRDLGRMRVAMALRGQPRRPSFASLRALGWVLASLMLRSHERADRIYMAMRLRGYGEPAALPDAARVTRADWLRLGVLLAALAAALALEAAP